MPQFEFSSAKQRFLTDAAKRNILASWEQTKRDWGLGSLSGVGEPDSDIVPWCDRINALPGLCTLQSCAGHLRGGVIEAAHLWIWMSEAAAKNFDRAAFSLLRRRDRIDWISKHYLHDGKEIASITFFGNERDLLESSVSIVYDFAVRTRQMEKILQLIGDQRRADLRRRVRDHNSGLSSAAKVAGVKRYGLFHAAGIRAMYNMALDAMKVRRGIDDSDWLGRAGIEELAANDFRIKRS